MRIAVLALVLATSAGTAAAGNENWFFGRERAREVGPFHSYNACNRARAVVRRHHPDEDVEQCSNRVDGSMAVRLDVSRVSVGLVAGPGFTDRRADAVTTGAASAGVEASVLLGRPYGGVELFGGAIAADGTSAMDGPRVVTPLGIGVVASPGNDKIRADIGIGGMFAVATGCSGCTLGSGVRAHAGVDFWLRPTLGVSVAAIAQLLSVGDYTDHGFHGPEGHTYEAPRLVLRVSALLAAW